MPRVGLTYNLKEDRTSTPEVGKPEDDSAEFDCIETIDALEEAISSEGHSVVRLGGGLEIIERLRLNPVDIVFNIAEGQHGRNREAHIPALLEMLGIPYTGSDALTLALCLDKAMTKRVVGSAGVPTPKFFKVGRIEDLEALDLKYPLFAKPVAEGSSKGIRNTSRIETRRELYERVRWLIETYRQPVLVEEFLGGPEYTVGILGNGKLRVLGIMQILNRGKDPSRAIYSYEVKQDWQRQVEYLCPAPISEELKRNIEEISLRAYEVLECRDVARMDIRLDEDGKPFFLEVNPLPGLSPVYSDLPIMARRVGIGYEELVNTILNNALSRCGLKP
ncbi:MAG: D-alanine--D-alanine ligase family protein [bacterium]